jgi:hypothetical protein
LHCLFANQNILKLKKALKPIKEEYSHWRKLRTAFKTGFLTQSKLKLIDKQILKKSDVKENGKPKELSEEQAATMIQARYRGFAVRKGFKDASDSDSEQKEKEIEQEKQNAKDEIEATINKLHYEKQRVIQDYKEVIRKLKEEHSSELEKMKEQLEAEKTRATQTIERLYEEKAKLSQEILTYKLKESYRTHAALSPPSSATGAGSPLTTNRSEPSISLRNSSNATRSSIDVAHMLSRINTSTDKVRIILAATSLKGSGAQGKLGTLLLPSSTHSFGNDFGFAKLLTIS